VSILIRRKQGKESDIELRLLPKYSSTNKQIRLMRLLNSGGFGVVWKARYKGQTVAIKLIRMDKFKNKNDDNMRYFNTVKIVVEEASIMELMVHERIVKYIMFEIESLGIVLEYLPLGSLYDYIQKSKGGMPWTDRYQMMLDICEGMEFLHSNVYASGKMKKVLFHQDLKSGNVLLCMEGSKPILRGKISDFGLSCKVFFRLTIHFSPERQSYKQECT
jgi:serine/threonine protein kinase